MPLDPLSSAFDLGKLLIQKIWPDPAKQSEEMRLLEELRQKGALSELQAHVTLLQGQMAINAKEAEHKSVFVAGWRPFVGWVGGFSLAYVAILEPLMRFVALMLDYQGEFPVIDTSLTMQVLMGMLGVAGLRSYDKKNNVATDRIK